MKLGYRGKITAFLFLACFLAGFFYFTFAQTNQEMGIPEGVQISPARMDWDLISGQERIGTINLKNYSDKPYQIDMEIEDFYVSDDSTEAKFFVPNENHPLKALDVINWVQIDNKTVSLAPNEGKDIMFTVKVPENTPTGGYYGAIFFKSEVSNNSFTNPQGKESQIKINQRVGMLLVMAVKGSEPIRRSGEINSFKTSKKLFWQSPTEFLTEVKNSGNLHYRAFGKIDIYKFSRKLKTIELTPLVLYPDKIRKYVTQWEFSNWSYGYYKAKLQMASEDQQIQVNAETTFWVIPWKTTLSIIVLFIIIWLIFRIFTSKFEIKKKEDNKDESDNDNDNNIRSEKSTENSAE